MWSPDHLHRWFVHRDPRQGLQQTGVSVIDLSWMRPKLAKLCGVTLHDGVSAPPGWSVGAPNTRDYRFNPRPWAPDENVGQAIRCLEAIGPLYAWTIRRREVTLSKITDAAWNPTRVTFTDSIPQNICLAIAAALGWETP